jgi:phage/plasmid-like protein (TIGR03299 family)
MSALVETMAYAGQVPWHGLGTKVDDDLTVPQMLEAAELDWEVVKRPTYYEMSIPRAGKKPSRKRFPTGKQALVRESDNRILSNVSGTWEPCQNHEAFSIFEEFVDRNELEMHTAGSLKDGQIVWGLAKMKNQFVLFDDDVTEQYLLLVNPHIYGRTIHVRNTPIRVVCNNTLTMSLSQDAKVSANQTHINPFDVEAMKGLIGIATLQLDKYADMARFIGSKKFNDQTVQEYFDRVWPHESLKGKTHSAKSKMAMEMLETQPGAEFGKGTYWNAFNTVTYMSDHINGKDQTQRLNCAWFGLDSVRKIKALDLAVEFAEAA